MKPGDVITPFLPVIAIGYEKHIKRVELIWVLNDIIVLLEHVSIRVMPNFAGPFITGWRVMGPNGTIAFLEDADVERCKVVVSA